MATEQEMLELEFEQHCLTRKSTLLVSLPHVLQ